MDANLQLLDNSFEEIFAYDSTVRPFRLFDLHPELWLRICHEAVTYPKPINVTRAATTDDQANIVSQPPLTRTCKLLRTEALPMFYRNNTFEARHFCCIACPRQWLVAIGTANLKAMGSINLYTKYDGDDWKEWFRQTGLDVEVRIAFPETRYKAKMCGMHGSDAWHQMLTITFV